MISAPLACSSMAFEIVLSKPSPLGAITTTGVPFSISASVPCFSSLAGIPSAWM